MSGLDESRLRHAFLEEAEELSQKLGETLMALESDRTSAHLVNEVFRLTHSLKSESALMGFAALSAVAHRMEDVLGLARNGSLTVDKPVIESLFAGADLIAEMMAAIGKGGSDADFSTREVLSGLSAYGGSASGSAQGGPGGAAHGQAGQPGGAPRPPPPSWPGTRRSSSGSSRSSSSRRRATGGRRSSGSPSTWTRRRR